MQSSTKKWLKRIGIGITVLLLIALAFGAYLYSLLPPTIGKPIVLQSELFNKPEKEYPFESKYLYKSASELAAMIRNHEATSVDIVKTYIAYIKNNNYKYNALIWLREAEALEDARLADEAVARGNPLGLLHGVPVTIKEQFWVKGSPCTLNAKMYGFTAPSDGAIVEQIKKSGAIILGTTNVPFMLSDYQTQGEVYPTASNPYDTTRTPGGSTGGGAAALAAGFTTLELGSDLGGSIRVPAAFCGLYGLKTTFGTLNLTEGDSPDTTTKYTRLALAAGGPLARTPDDLELMWQIIRDTKRDERFQKPVEWKPESTKNLSEYRIAWMDEWSHGGKKVQVGNEVKGKLNMLVDSLQHKGVAMEKTAPDLYDEMVRLFFVSFAGMMGENQPWIIRQFIKQDFASFDDGTGAIEAFNDMMDDPSDQAWLKSNNDRQALVVQWEAFFKQYDFFICPVAGGPAFKKCPKGTPLSIDGHPVGYMQYIGYTTIFNASGNPSIIVPMGLNKAGLPIALQIVGPYYSEPELLRFAKLLKPVTPGFVRPTF